MEWFYYFLMLALLVVGLGVQLMGLPGLWLMAAAAALYELVTPGRYLYPWPLVIILGLCLLAELLEFLAGAGGAAKAGGSKRSMAGGIIGGVVGAIVLSIPVPIIGTIAGVVIGAFAGSTLAQYTKQRDFEHSTRVGFGAAKGTLIGILLKLAIGTVILIFTAFKALPTGGTPPAPQPQPPPPATAPITPATSPTTLPDVEAGP